MLEMMNLREDKLEIVRQHIHDSPGLLEKKDNFIDQIYGTARARVALTVCASYINMLIRNNDENGSKNSDDITSVLQMAETLCDGRPLTWYDRKKMFQSGIRADDHVTFVYDNIVSQQMVFAIFFTYLSKFY